MSTELFVYGDESGIEKTQPYCVVAGFIASPAQWESFNTAWRQIINEAGVDEFHSKDFFGRHSAAAEGTKNQFRDWSDSRANNFLADLLKVIKNHQPRIKPIGCAMDINAFFEFSWGERKYLTGAIWNRDKSRFITQGAPSRVYPVPFFSMVGEALENARPPDCKVHFVMDEQKVIQNGVQQVYSAGRTNDRIAPALRRKIGDLTPGLSEEHEGIQAADLLAHSWYGWYSQRQNLRRDRLEALMEIFQQRGRREIGVIRKRGLECILKALRPEDRAKIKALRTAAEIQKSKSS